MGVGMLRYIRGKLLMLRLIIPSFLGLGFAFYYLSGGKNFEPAAFEKQKQDQTVVVQAIAPRVEIDTHIADDKVSARATQVKQEYAKVFAESVPASDTPTLRSGASLWKVAAGGDDVQARIATLSDPTSFVELTRDTVGAVGVDADMKRFVNATRVNLRNGPGTNHNVVGKLDRDTEVALLNKTIGSWVKLRVIETNRVGWISASLLRE